MKSITIKAPAKINLGLDVIKRRADGYHEVRMVMQSIALYDELTVETAEHSDICLVTDREDLPADDSNLVCRAARVLREHTGFATGLRISLKKNIPMAAGMAGGSTDAAAAFVGINELLGLKLTREELCALAVKVGADVPFCIMQGTMLSEGIGEKLTPLKTPPACHVLIAKPDADVSTKYVYENLHVDTVTAHPDMDSVLRAIEESDFDLLCRSLDNILEPVTAGKLPVIGEIEALMEENGAHRALMTGSGPTVFGLFTDRKRAEECGELIRSRGLSGQVYVTEFHEIQPQPSVKDYKYEKQN